MTDLPKEDQREGAEPGCLYFVLAVYRGKRGQCEGAELAAKKKPLLPPSRIALLVFVIVAAVAIVFELRARGSYKGTVERLNQKFEELQESGDAFYRDDLMDLIQGSPSSVRDEENGTETFTWRGIRAHRIEVQYGKLDFIENFQTL